MRLIMSETFETCLQWIRFLTLAGVSMPWFGLEDLKAETPGIVIGFGILVCGNMVIAPYMHYIYWKDPTNEVSVILFDGIMDLCYSSYAVVIVAHNADSVALSHILHGLKATTVIEFMFTFTPMLTLLSLIPTYVPIIFSLRCHRSGRRASITHSPRRTRITCCTATSFFCYGFCFTNVSIIFLYFCNSTM
eukprot:UN27833